MIIVYKTKINFNDPRVMVLCDVFCIHESIYTVVKTPIYNILEKSIFHICMSRDKEFFVSEDEFKQMYNRRDLNIRLGMNIYSTTSVITKIKLVAD